jgi:ubiquinone/menaquinone biosynthesis C-methylase UbiE
MPAAKREIAPQPTAGRAHHPRRKGLNRSWVSATMAQVLLASEERLMAKQTARRRKPAASAPAAKPLDESSLESLTWEAWRARAVMVAVSLGVFDRLAKSPATVQQVARDLRCQGRATGLLLDALVGMGLLRQRGSIYANGPLATRLLATDAEDGIAANFLHHDRMWADWGTLADAIKVGRPVLPPAAAAADERAARIFITAMHATGVRFGARLAKAFPTRGPVRMLDVAGGSGIWSVHFARANRQLTSVVYDLPATVKLAKKLIKDAPERKRVRFIIGDYNTDKLPPRQDLALVSQVLHSMDEPHAVRLLAKVHKTLVDGGVLLVRDMLTNPAHTAPAGAALFSLNMLLHSDGGRAYSVEEVKSWLAEVGFKKITHHRVVPGSNTSVLRGEK